ncbi:MAG: hypothetical protein ISQ52_01295 [Synechococcus sp. BS307-5m-G38]|nr:hypothetical protein [Synechococcus sp. BS307-5m-G38]
MLSRTSKALIGLSASWILALAWPFAATADTSMRCVIGSEQQACSVLWQDDALEIQLEDGRQLHARRLGRWSTTTRDGVSIKQCNMRINLGDDVVYGLLTRSSITGTTLTWPRLQIELPDLKP